MQSYIIYFGMAEEEYNRAMMYKGTQKDYKAKFSEKRNIKVVID